jgi:hypothetical protein
MSPSNPLYLDLPEMTPPNIRYEIGNCYSCTQGRACIAYSNASGEYFIVCEECFTEWPDPGSFHSRKNAAFEAHGRFEYAIPGQMSNHPWRGFVLNVADLDSETEGTIPPPLG